MDFISKNFRYATERFGVVLERAAAGEKVYLRALSRDQPTHQPANIEQDFPELAMDFCLPETLSYVRDHLFSSVLRVSGRVNMWLHYDVSCELPTSSGIIQPFQYNRLSDSQRSWRICMYRSREGSA